MELDKNKKERKGSGNKGKKKEIKEGREKEKKDRHASSSAQTPSERHPPSGTQYSRRSGQLQPWILSS